MERKRVREIALGGLALALIGAATWFLGGRAPVPHVEGVAARSLPPPANQPDTRKRGEAEIDLRILQAERPEPGDSHRNPFRFKPKAPPPPPPGPVSRQGSSGPGADGSAAQAPPPAARIPLKFIGLMSQTDPKAGTVAILSDSRGVYYGREGEIIEGRYRIVRIGVESIDLAHLDSSGRQTIRLTGQ